MRFFCDLEGYKDCYIEVKDRWTRKELMAIVNISQVEPFLDAFATHVTACLLRTGDGKEISDPKSVTAELFDEMDVAFSGYVIYIFNHAQMHLTQLGNALTRLRSTGSGGTG